jgi:DNA-binding response OmpR family regulator
MTTSAPERPGPLQLLLVDDDVVVRDSLCHALESEGFAVCGTSNGVEAVHRFAAGCFDAVLLDLSFAPRRGRDTLDGIRAINPDTPIALLTVRPEDCRTPAAITANAVIEKPLSVSRLVQTLHALLQQRRQPHRDSGALRNPILVPAET